MDDDNNNNNNNTIINRILFPTLNNLCMDNTCRQKYETVILQAIGQKKSIYNNHLS